MSLSLSQYITQVRAFLDDTSSSRKTVENLTNLVVGGMGSRKSFNLSKTNLVPGATKSDVNKSGFTPSGFTTDDANGLITFTIAPPLSTNATNPTSLDILYFYQEFTDDQIQNFVDYGLNKIGFPGSLVATNYETIDYPNFNVVCLYGASAGFRALAGRYAKFVDTSAEGKSSQKSKIFENYDKQAQDYEKRADAERLSVQGSRQGRSTVANLSIKSNVPRSANWTPRR